MALNKVRGNSHLIFNNQLGLGRWYYNSFLIFFFTFLLLLFDDSFATSKVGGSSRDGKRPVAGETHFRLKPRLARVVMGLEEPPSEEMKTILQVGEWLYLRSGNFHYFFEKSSDRAKVASRANQVLRRIAWDLGMSKEKLKAVSVKTILARHKSWRATFPAERAIGIAKYEQQEIFVNMSYGQVSVDTFLHELAHCLLHRQLRTKSIPLWFDEGIACFESKVLGEKGGTYISQEELLKRMQSGKWFPLRKLLAIQDYPRDPKEKGLFYAESKKLVEFIVGKGGRGTLAEFIESYIKFEHPPSVEDFTHSVNLATKGKLPEDIEALEERWKRFLAV